LAIQGNNSKFNEFSTTKVMSYNGNTQMEGRILFSKLNSTWKGLRKLTSVY
jgi:hypothetical protein